MKKVNLFDAKTHLSRLIDEIATGAETEIVIARNGKPVARVVPLATPDVSRRIGIAEGEFVLADDIDQHNEEIASLFAADDASSA